MIFTETPRNLMSPYVQRSATLLAAFASAVLALCITAPAAKSFEPEFYAFFNGMPGGQSHDDEAKMLKELGYTGISQVYAAGGGAKLVERAAAYEKHGVKVLSLYLSASEKPIEPEVVTALANGGMIELTVQKKITPEIV